jgi:DNA-binding NarL/FixJ family response regulator
MVKKKILETYDPKKGSFKHYIITALSWTLRKPVKLELMYDELVDECVIDSLDLEIDMERFTERLSKREQKIIVMREKGLKLREIAAKMRCSIQNICLILQDLHKKYLNFSKVECTL